MSIICTGEINVASQDLVLDLARVGAVGVILQFRDLAQNTQIKLERGDAAGASWDQVLWGIQGRAQIPWVIQFNAPGPRLRYVHQAGTTGSYAYMLLDTPVVPCGRICLKNVNGAINAGVRLDLLPDTVSPLLQRMSCTLTGNRAHRLTYDIDENDTSLTCTYITETTAAGGSHYVDRMEVGSRMTGHIYNDDVANQMAFQLALYGHVDP